MQHLNPEISPALEGHPYFYQGATSSPIFCKLAWFGFCWRLEGRLESCKNLSCRNKSRTKTSHMIGQENTYQNWRKRIPYPAKICKQQDKTRRDRKYTWNSAILPAIFLVETMLMDSGKWNELRERSLGIACPSKACRVLGRPLNVFSFWKKREKKNWLFLFFCFGNDCKLT